MRSYLLLGGFGWTSNYETFRFISDSQQDNNHKSKSGLYERKKNNNKKTPIKSNSSSWLRKQQCSCSRTRGSGPKHGSFSWQAQQGLGRFWADRRACSSLSRPPGESDWINSSLRTSCSLRGHQGNMEWKGKMERLYLALIGLVPVCTLDCSINTAHICYTTEMIHSARLIPPF